MSEETNSSSLGSGTVFSSIASGGLGGLLTSGGIPVIGAAFQPLDNYVSQAINWKYGNKMIDPQTAIKLWLRKEIDDVRVIFYLKVAGYPENQIEFILRSSMPLVPPSDNIRFAVKEAFTPELVKDLIGDEKTPDRFIFEMEKWGYSKQTAIDYWTAHYDPLGKGEFEEMLHRLHPEQLKVEVQNGWLDQKDADALQFDEEFLDRMYRLKDVYPALRPRLRHISYKTPSRIDIRRFEDFDVIDSDMLTYFNRALGYSPDIAELMTLWTRVNNIQKDIKPLVAKGLMSEDDVIQEFLKEGATPATAAKLATRMMRFSKHEKSESNRDLTVGYIKEAYKIKFRDEAESRTLLKQAGYDADEVNFLIGLWNEEIKMQAFVKRKDKDLTRSAIEARYRLDKLQNKKDRIDQLIEIGYDDDEAEFWLKNVELKESAKTVKVAAK